MKSNDLRIGNLVYYKVEDELDDRKEWNDLNIVDAEDILYLEACETNKWQHSYSPIPLTEEWLAKFGFKYESGIEDFYAIQELGTMIWANKKLYRQGCVAIEYVHQLQNLYFIMTGKELKYQPKK